MTVHITQLWLPILLGGVLAWFMSALIHMVLKYHNSDYQALPNEGEVQQAVGNGQLRPGFYSFPHCSDMSEMKNPAIQEKFTQGPVGFLAIFPNGMPAMGKLLIQQMAFFVIGCALIAYLAALSLPAGATYLTVFRFVGTAAFVAFGWANVPYSIWMGHPWSTTARYLLDALLYALVVAGAFAWLWPEV